MTIPWFYIYSPKYEIFHHILCSSLLDCSEFKAQPVFFPQSAFERKVKPGEHIFAGNALKFNMILEKISCLPENTPFILSDVDIYVRDAARFYKVCETELCKNNITGMAEWTDNKQFTNIGILLCKNSIEVRTFFAFLASSIESLGAQDQALYNSHVDSFVASRGVFSTGDVIQSNMRELYGSSFCVMQFLSSSSYSDMNVYEKLITAATFLDITPLMHLVSYEIREALVLFYKDRFPSNPVAMYELKE